MSTTGLEFEDSCATGSVSEFLLSHEWRELGPKWTHRDMPRPVLTSEALYLQMIWLGAPSTGASREADASNPLSIVLDEDEKERLRLSYLF